MIDIRSGLRLGRGSGRLGGELASIDPKLRSTGSQVSHVDHGDPRSHPGAAIESLLICLVAQNIPGRPHGAVDVTALSGRQRGADSATRRVGRPEQLHRALGGPAAVQESRRAGETFQRQRERTWLIDLTGDFQAAEAVAEGPFGVAAQFGDETMFSQEQVVTCLRGDIGVAVTDTR